MAGLLNPAQPAAPTAPAADPSQPPGAAPAADPSQPPQGDQAGQGQPPQGQPQGPPIQDGPVDDETYKKMTANCMTTVTHGLKQILQMIAQAQDKPGALATAAVQVLLRVEDSFEESGGTLVLTMSFNAGAETLIDIADACDQAGVHQFGQKEIEAAFLQAVDKYRVTRASQGRIDQAQMKQQLEQMKTAADDGSLEKQFPGLDTFTKQATHNAKPAYQPQGGAAPAGPAGPAAPAEGDDAAEPGAEVDTPETDPSEADGAAPASNDFPPEMLKNEKAPAKKVAPKAKPKKGQR